MQKKSGGHPRMGTRLRGQLADAYEARGHYRSSLWLLYSTKAKADIVLRSDLEFGHFLLVESDPEVHKADYSPGKRVATLAGEGVGSVVDAEVTLRSGAVVWREIKYTEEVDKGSQNRAHLQLLIQLQAAEPVAARHELLTEKEIFAQPQRIHNWLRIVPWLAQAREWPLYEYGNVVAALLNARRSVEFREVLALGEGQERGLYAASLFRAVQSGLIQSDLDVLPWTMRSRFYLPERRP